MVLIQDPREAEARLLEGVQKQDCAGSKVSQHPTETKTFSSSGSKTKLSNKNRA